tara:strand:+ start:972 stop:1286 length:315 start_codon:yes stop_codon:yes gene_type:complete
MPTITAGERLCKQPGERRQYSMDFSELMATVDTIEESSPAPVATHTNHGSGDALTIGTPTVSGQTVLMWISGGTHNNRYRIQITLTTSTTAILVGDGVMDVQNN